MISMIYYKKTKKVDQSDFQTHESRKKL